VRKRVQDSAQVRVRPSVSVPVADQAALDAGGAAARIDVTVTCPASSNGQGGQVTILQGRAAGTGSFGSVACDGLPHTLSVSVATSQGLFQVGSAEAEAFASVEEGAASSPAPTSGRSSSCRPEGSTVVEVCSASVIRPRTTARTS
jgi:hypothetical protein